MTTSNPLRTLSFEGFPQFALNFEFGLLFTYMIRNFVTYIGMEELLNCELCAGECSLFVHEIRCAG